MRVPFGVRLQVLGVDELTSDNNCPVEPVSVNVPLKVCVDPAANCNVRAVVQVAVRLLNVELPLIACMEPPAPFNVSVPLLCVNVPPVRVKSPETDKVPEVEVNVPVVSENIPPTVSATLPPVKVPLDCNHPEVPVVMVFVPCEMVPL